MFHLFGSHRNSSIIILKCQSNEMKEFSRNNISEQNSISFSMLFEILFNSIWNERIISQQFQSTKLD